MALLLSPWNPGRRALLLLTGLIIMRVSLKLFYVGSIPHAVCGNGIDVVASRCLVLVVDVL